MPTPKPTPKPTSDVGAMTGKTSGVGVGATTGVSSDVGSGVMPTKPKATGKPKKAADPWAPVLSAGQAILDTLSTPLYAVEGGLNAALKGKDPIAGAAENATSWTKGKRPVTGSELLKTAGIEPNFWTSLIADVVLDPLTYTPGVVFSAPLKAVGIAGKAAVKAGKLAAKGEKAAIAGAEGAKLATGFKTGFQKKPMQEWVGGKAIQTEITGASESTKAFLAKFANKQQATKEMLQKRTYTTVPVTGTRTAAQTANDVLVSAFIAGKHAMVGTVLSEGAKNTLRKYARKEKNLLNKIQQTTPNDIAKQMALETAVQAPKITKKTVEDLSTKTTEELIAKPTPPKTGKQIAVPTMEETAPSYLEIKKLAEAAPNTAETSTLKALLKNVNKASKEAKVTSFAPTNVEKQIGEILHPKLDAHVNQVSTMNKDMFKRIKEAVVREDGASPFSLYRRFAGSPVGEIATLTARIGELKLEDAAGRKLTIAQIAKSAPNDNQIPLDLIKQASKSLENIFLKRGTPDGLETIRYNQLVKLVGKDLADKFKATGALNPSKKTNEAALNALKQDLPKPGAVTATNYDGFDNLITGLRNGDIVDTDSLLKVIRALDPEGKLEAQVEVAMSKDPFVGLKELLTSPRQVNSVFDARNRLAKADPDTMFKATNIGLSDVASTYFKGILEGSVTPQPEVLLQGRQQAGKDLVQIRNINREVITDAENALARGISATQEEIQKKELKFLTTSAGGSVVRRSTKGKMNADSSAVRSLEINENVMTKVYGSLFGTGTSKAAKSKTFERQETRLKDFAYKVNAVEKLSLAVYGVRPIVRKQAAKTAKGTKQHFAFLHLGDFANIALKFGGDFENVANHALFPRTPGKYDGISTTGLAEAMRMVLESVEKKLPLSQEELVAKLISTGANQKAWSAEFRAQMPQIANDIATQLARPEVKDMLIQAHSNRMLADVAESTPLAIEMTQEIVDLIESAYKVATENGTVSPATTIETVRQYFYEFVYKSNILNQNYGPAGEAVLKSAATMFIKDGKVGGLQIIPSDSEELLLFREGLANFYKHTDVDFVAPAGRETFKYPNPATQERLQVEMLDLQKGLDESRAVRAGLTTKDAVKQWAKDHAKLQARLDKVRPKAWEAWLSTYHWNGQKWVDSRDFDAELAAKIEKENQIFITDEGSINIGAVLNETKPNNVAPKRNAAQKKAGIKARNDAAVKRGDELAIGAKTDAAAHILDKMPEIERMLPDDPIAQSERMQQEYYQHTLNGADIETYIVRQNYDPPMQLGMNEKSISTRQKLAEQTSGTYGKQSVIHITSIAETSMLNAIKSVQDLAFKIFSDYKGKFSEVEYLDGFRYALAGTTPTDGTLLFKDYTAKLTQLVEPLRAELAVSKDKLEALNAAFRFYNIGPNVGVSRPSEMEDLRDILLHLPFAKMPDNIAENSDLAGMWNDRLNAFKKSGTDPLQMLLNISAAVQMSKTQTAIGRQFAIEFGQKVTPQKAAQLGLVKLKSIGDAKFDLTIGVPEGYYFDKYYAEQLGAMARNWNDIYEKGMPQFIRIVLDITGMLKATQTVLNPRHHIVTFTGDMMTAMLAGARNPVDFVRGMRIAFKHAGEDFTANWSKSGADKTLKDIMTRRLKAVGGATYKEGDEAIDMTVLIGSKKVAFNNDTLLEMMDNIGGLTNVSSHDQIQGAYEAAIGTPFAIMTETEKGLRKTQLTKYREGITKVSSGFQKAIRPASAFVSYAGNIPRLAHAFHIMRSRNWTSMDEMMGAVSDAMNLNHPTIQSLTGWERKYPRTIFSYYTWLKQAHVATINIMMHHTAAMTLYPKVQYNAAEEQGFDPTSIGNPWRNKLDTPNYLNYSIYGPTYNGPRGAMMMKPSVMPLDVLDTYNLSYDPAFTLDQNAIRNLGQIGQGVIGKNVNFLAQLPLELMTRTNPGTGKPTQVKDLETLMDRMFSMTGFYNVAKGTGLYTPPNKTMDSANPLTQRDRDLLLQNWLLGFKQADVYTPSSVSNAQSEQTARQNAFMQQWVNKNK